jgi:GH43 family beta-xylosidase
MKLCSLFFLFFWITDLMSQQGKTGSLLPGSIPNPVLPGVADAGAIRFNGQYYIGGVFTNGGFYVSKDLVNWKGPHHVFSMHNKWATGEAGADNQIHASDIVYLNGMFHHYWSVNYWGNDKNVIHIGHAVADRVLGPYKEPDTLTWLDNRIDPKLFVDDDGKLYMYMVKFTDGNTIWARPMKDPSVFSGAPVYIFASLPNTWETMDNRVAEGPWVMRYRDNYYMMYNTNHTSTQWGNYILGVAQAPTPLEFNNGNKYSYPVVQSNQFDFQDRFVDLLKYDSVDNGEFSYTLHKPAENDWMLSVRNSANWKIGRPGFAAEITKGSTTRKKSTDWTTEEIWIRKNFSYDKSRHGNLSLRLNHSGATKVYLNGHLIYDSTGSKYIAWNFDSKAAGHIKQGNNIIAVYSQAGRRPLLDISLFAMRDKTADDILYSPGQPNILKGPNGFEWWLIYMADKTNTRRSQYIDRVHFFDKTMYVDGITAVKTPGYHPLPSKPSFADLFDDSVFNKKNYRFISGDLGVSSEEAKLTGSNALDVLLNVSPATHYLFETGIRCGSKSAGIYACYLDQSNYLKILLNRDVQALQVETRHDGRNNVRNIKLPAGFNFDVYHTITVRKNSSRFYLELDGIKFGAASDFVEPAFIGKAVPGLYSEPGNTAFDGIIFTKGFDEYDKYFSGWTDAPGIEPGTKWTVNSSGLTGNGKPGISALVKGDVLDSYEFSVQVTSKDTTGKAGIYAAYIDSNNYVKSTIDYASHSLNIEVKEKGKIPSLAKIPLRRSSPYYADIKYSDFFEKTFSLSAPALVSGLKLSRQPAFEPDTLLDNIAEQMDILYQVNDRWYPLKNSSISRSFHPGFDSLSFTPVYATGLRFVNKKANDRRRYIYKIWVDEECRVSYNLRVRKTGSEILFFVDGESTHRIKNNVAPSRVGLITEHNSATFNGALLYHIPE